LVSGKDLVDQLADEINKAINDLLNDRREDYPVSVLEDEFLFGFILFEIDKILDDDQFQRVRISVCQRNYIGYITYLSLIIQAEDAEELIGAGERDIKVSEFNIQIKFDFDEEDNDLNQDQFGIGV